MGQDVLPSQGCAMLPHSGSLQREDGVIASTHCTILNSWCVLVAWRLLLVDSHPRTPFALADSTCCRRWLTSIWSHQSLFRRQHGVHGALSRPAPWCLTGGSRRHLLFKHCRQSSCYNSLRHICTRLPRSTRHFVCRYGVRPRQQRQRPLPQ